MRKNKFFSGEDKVLHFAVAAVVVLFLAGACVIGVRMMNLRVDASEGKAKLEELEKLDVQEIDVKIQELEEAERQADEERQNRPNSEKFAGCLIIGDSISQGLYEYGVLDSSFVIAELGAGTYDPDETGFTDIMNRAIAAKPQKLFLALGMNDVEAARGDADVFIESYKAALAILQEGLPDTKIYINSILPAGQNKIAENEWYGNIPAYNEKLKELCEDEGIVFIDNTSLVLEEYYTEDGIHMSPDYYPGWADHMAEAADL